MLTTEILVCVLCRPGGAPREVRRDGLSLFDMVQEACLRENLSLRTRAIECMSACDRSCSVALQAAGKTTYLFGDLRPTDGCVRAILDCATMHANSADGTMARAARPELMREGILARVPAPQPMAQALLVRQNTTAQRI